MKNLLLVLSWILAFTVNLYSGTIYYVKYNAAGSNNGSSWADAFTSFQSALTAAASGDQIWVAKGTYKPSYDYGLGGGARFYHFRLINGVAIYGGFAGSENTVSERTLFGVGEANETIFSGDIGTEGDNTDNCYHVFYHPDGLGLTSSAVLDGFTIKGGNANGSSGGGGMYNSSSSPTVANCAFTSNYGNGINNYYSSPTLTNCIFISNSTSGSGGGMYNSSSSPTLTNCIFSSNSVGGNGGGMWNYSSFPTITNCTFSSNLASGYGGGMGNQSSSPNLTNCTFSSNSVMFGGGMYNYSSSPALNNCIIWGNEASIDGDEFYIDGGTTTLNYSCYANASGDVYINSGTFTATNNNITSDPQFAGTSINPTYPYSILGTSPCVDAGNDSYNSQVYDIRGAGYPRKLNKTTGGVGTIDMGAYEYRVVIDPLPVELTSFTATANGATVTLNWQTTMEVNNYGFEIERRTISNQQISQSSIDNWQKIGFVKGAGTSNAPKEYSYSDAMGSTGSYVYRLKQVDNDGSFKYSQSVEVTTHAPEQFALAQNYPNPFNPSTQIEFSIPQSSHVTLKVFDVLGKEVATLVNSEKEIGTYTTTWNAQNCPSGVYFYRLTAGSYTLTKKLVLMR